MIAQVDGSFCGLCGRPIVARVDEIVPRGEGWIHKSCHPGQDDVTQRRTRRVRQAVTTTPAGGDSSGVAAEPPVEQSGVRTAPPAGPPMVMEIPENPDGWVCENLDEPTYHAHPTSLSSTGVKTIIKESAATFDYERRHPVFKNEYDVGSAAHYYALGAGPEIVEVQVTDAKTGEQSPASDWRTKSAKDHRDRIRAAGQIPILRKDHDVVKAMAEQLQNHELAAQLLSAGKPEVSAFAVHKETGVMRRGRVDLLRKRIIVDFKSSLTANPDKLHKIAYDNGWYIQAPYYMDLFRDLGHDIERFMYVVQQKTPPYLVSVIVLDHAAMQLGRAHIREGLERFRDCTESGIWPGYQADGTETILSLPKFAFADRSTP